MNGHRGWSAGGSALRGLYRRAFEIHLPQVVGKRMPETLPRSRGTAGLRADAAIAAQDAVDRARRKDDAAVAREDVGNFACAPGGMVITCGEDGLPASAAVRLGLFFGRRERSSISSRLRHL